MKKREYPWVQQEVRAFGHADGDPEGAIIKIEAGGRLSLARVKKKTLWRYVSSFGTLNPPVFVDNKQYSYAITTWREDEAGVKLPDGGHQILGDYPLTTSNESVICWA